MQIISSLPDLKDRRLRLIHSGRLLTDGTLLHEWLKTLEERQERATSRSQEVLKEDHLVTWLHCSVGPKIEPGESEEETPLVRGVRRHYIQSSLLIAFGHRLLNCSH
jgi:hypothetical protein